MAQVVMGRQPELARIDAFLAGIPVGAHALVIDGEPGMGKTTLWLAGLDGASSRDWRILAAHPSEAEATFAYAAIGDLLQGTDDDALALLPEPQRRALRVALLRDEPEGGAPDPGVVAVSFLNALRGLARAGPTLVAVDDVQWLDSPSALAIGFAIRRLGSEPIGFLLARRIEGPAGLPLGLDRPPAGATLERMAVGPLGLGAIGDILQGRLAVTFPRATLHRIHATSGGNPLFAIELGRTLGNELTSVEAGMDLPLPDELMSLLGRQLESLPAATQDALAIVAALAYPTVELVTQAAQRPAERALQPAVDAHVIAVEDSRIRFTHPLRAAAARSRTSPGRRRGIHARLASVVTDPEERARHLALAATGPDEATAAALEEAARRAGARGAPASASELAALAGRLTPPDRLDDIRRRGLAEAVWRSRTGDPLGARPLLENLLASSPPGPVRAEVLSVLGWDYINIDFRTALDLLRDAVSEAGDDDRMRMRCEHYLAGILDLLGEDYAEVGLHIRAMLEAAERLEDEAGLAGALGFVVQNDQRRTGHAPAELIERVRALEPAMRNEVPVLTWPTRGLAEMASWTDDLAAAIAQFDWFCQQALERGEETSRIIYTAELIVVECAAGEWQRALAHADEGLALTIAASQVAFQAITLAGRALAEAHLGDTQAARRDADDAVRLAAPRGVLLAERVAAWALGILELSLGNHAAAHEQLGPLVEGRRIAGVGEPGDMRFVSDEVEALIGMGLLAEAEAMLDWYEGLARTIGRAFAVAACDRCRGLLHGARGEIDAAVAALEASRDRYATIADPFGQARTLLALGTIQRRALRRSSARETLEAAAKLFEGLGAKLWAARARAELARIGGRQAVGDELTPSERQVADLVAEGRTNREVAAALVLSERTVEGHLSRIYAKLQVRSRTELAHRLTADAEPLA